MVHFPDAQCGHVRWHEQSEGTDFMDQVSEHATDLSLSSLDSTFLGSGVAAARVVEGAVPDRDILLRFRQSPGQESSGVGVKSLAGWHHAVPARETLPFIDHGAFVFGPFRLCPSRRSLWEGNRYVRIGSRAFDILNILVERAGDVVGKSELIARVWPGIFVDEANLKSQICVMRRVLGEGRNGRRYTVTIFGRGYSFVEPVSFQE